MQRVVDLHGNAGRPSLSAEELDRERAGEQECAPDDSLGGHILGHRGPVGEPGHDEAVRQVGHGFQRESQQRGIADGLRESGRLVVVVEDPVLVLVDHEHRMPRGAQPVRGIQNPQAHAEHGMEERDISHAWERAPARSARQGATQMVWIRIDATTIGPVAAVVKPPTSMGVTSSSKIA